MINRSFMVLLLLLSTVFISGCATARIAASPETALPLAPEQSEAIRAQNMETGLLSLQEAISRALEHNPELQAYKLDIKAREARASQESLLPNPELLLEFENIAGSGPFSGLKGAETTVGIGQLIELSGKRSKRVTIAALQSELALWQYEIKRFDIITRVRTLYLKVLTAQKKLKLDHKLVELAQAFKLNVDTLVQAGRLSAAETARAQVELSNREVALRQSKRELLNSAQSLAALWGSNSVNFEQVNGTLEIRTPVPSAEQLLKALPACPLFVRQSVLIKRQKAKTALAEAQAVPDPVVSAGYRRFNESDDQAFVAGISIPIPVFDRNQGGRQEARYREQQSEHQLNNLQTNLQAEIYNRLEAIRSMNNEIETIQNTILPQAQKAYGIIQQNYRRGKYSLIDVLDAQRQLFDAEGRQLETLTRINLQIIELEGLLGRSLDSF